MKALLSLCIAAILMLANEEYGRLFRDLFKTIYHKRPVKVFVTRPQYRLYFVGDGVEVVKSCKEADVVFGDEKVCPKRYRFVLSRKSFKEGEHILGAFYWRKGRPQLRLKKEALLKIRGEIPKGLARYVY